MIASISFMVVTYYTYSTEINKKINFHSCTIIIHVQRHYDTRSGCNLPLVAPKSSRLPDIVSCIDKFYIEASLRLLFTARVALCECEQDCMATSYSCSIMYLYSEDTFSANDWISKWVALFKIRSFEWFDFAIFMPFYLFYVSKSLPSWMKAATVLHYYDEWTLIRWFYKKHWRRKLFAR